MPVAPEPDRVADRMALLELVARYAHTVDARDVPGILACFAADGSIFVAEWVATGRISKLKKLA